MAARSSLTRQVWRVLVFLAGLAPLVAFPQTWHYHSTARIVIAFSPEQRNLALQVLAEVQSEDRQLAERLQFTPTRTITVFLCPTQSSFDRVTGGIIPHWGEAAADPAAWRIFLKAMRLHEGKRVTIKHELVHLLLAELSYPQRLPRWFNEGAAILLSGETQHLEPALISRAMATNSLLTFDDLEAMLVFPREKAGLAYSESYHAVNFLVRRHGLAAIKKIAQALALFPTVEEAFHHACGEELFDFEVAYFDYVRENFRWYFLWDENLWWGVGFFLLFMAAYIVTRLRARKKAAAWEQEERELGEDDEHDQHNDEAKPET